MNSRRNESYGKINKFKSCESEQCKNVTVLGFAKGQSLNLSERQPISSNHNENNHQWQLMLSGQYIKMSINGASTICGLVSTVIHL
jgi:hypothetical protein